MASWLGELKRCRLCAWECGADRVAEGGGVCRIRLPEVAYTSVSPLTKSVTVTFLGCCFRCIYCNAYRISQYPDVEWFYRGHMPPESLAREMLDLTRSARSRGIEVDAVNFTGGEPLINLPYIEEVVRIMREDEPGIKVGLATNGFASQPAFGRMVCLASWVNFEVKAFTDEVHRSLTGAPVAPVLRNARYLITNGRDKVRVIRTVAIPGINTSDIPKIAGFLAGIDPSVPYRIVGFRPSFLLYYHPGPSRSLMGMLTKAARAKGLTDVSWSGYYPDEIPRSVYELAERASPYKTKSAKIASAYSSLGGCVMMPRNCGDCPLRSRCPATPLQPWSMQNKLEI